MSGYGPAYLLSMWSVCQEYADKLDDSGVHGAVLLLDSNFTADMMANLLAIPTSKSYVRRHLVTEYDVIVQQARYDPIDSVLLRCGSVKSRRKDIKFDLLHRN